MNVHSQHARNVIAWIVGIAAFSPLALCIELPSSRVTLSEVSGRVTYSGRPLSNAFLCLESGDHTAVGTIESDGSFRLTTINGRVGAFPGRYHGYLCTLEGGTTFPAKFRDPRTSGLEIEIASGWNELNIDLH